MFNKKDIETFKKIFKFQNIIILNTKYYENNLNLIITIINKISNIYYNFKIYKTDKDKNLLLNIFKINILKKFIKF